MVFADYFIINNYDTRKIKPTKSKSSPARIMYDLIFYQSSHTGLELTFRGDSYCSEFELF